MKRVLTGIAVAVALAMQPAYAVAFQLGDVFASIGGGRVAHFDSSLTLIEVLDNTTGASFTTGSTFDSAGNFYVTNFSSGSISKFDSQGNLVNANFINCMGTCESIVFDVAQNIYVGNVTGGINVYDSNGAFQHTLAAGTRIDFLDIAADQRTLLYTQEGSTIESHDALTNLANPDFATGLTGGAAFSIRILGDGGALVADQGFIQRTDSSGMLTDTYDLGGNNSWFALNLDPDGTSFWSGDFTTNVLAKFDLATGMMLAMLDLDTVAGLSSVQFFGLSVFGEIQAGGGGTVGAVPIPAALPLFLCGAAGLGFASRRRRKTA